VKQRYTPAMTGAHGGENPTPFSSPQNRTTTFSYHVSWMSMVEPVKICSSNYVGAARSSYELLHIAAME
jgi:hypothetical protein